jgi:RimJ/RimL family protein N-acetyltransferase
VAAYLEASNENSRRLYERHGFIVQRELPIPDGPSMWTMWRSPRS